ncbi:hypothetical protein IWQ60_003285 [Tieghemiomyces parasiticus]|uniref:Uncharacterized protein n=1 Tax=Tieghemiomyces parasiticus TaxID=78921 RepID=A0A9W8AAM1_9FUNG|nr:hypothetical protein IWQ60_003285 [Tieghemiomyces parasiticus]
MFRGHEGRYSRPTTPSQFTPSFEDDLLTLSSLAGVPTSKLSSRARVSRANIIGPSSTTAGYPSYRRDNPAPEPYYVDSHYHAPLPPVYPRYPGHTSYADSPLPRYNGSRTAHVVEEPTSHRGPYGGHSPPGGLLDPPMRHRPLPPSPFSQAPYASSPSQLSPLEQVRADSHHLDHAARPPPALADLAPPVLPRSPTSVHGAGDSHHPPTPADTYPYTPSDYSAQPLLSKVFSDGASRPIPTGPNARIIRSRREGPYAPEAYATSRHSAEDDLRSEDSNFRGSEWHPSRLRRQSSHTSEGPDAASDTATEARSNRMLEDLKITNQSLLAVNRAYEDKIRTQRQKITALEQRAGLRPRTTILEYVDDDEDDLTETHGSPGDYSPNGPPETEEEILSQDPAFRAAIDKIAVMIATGRAALSYVPEISGGKVLSQTEVQEQIPQDGSTAPVVDQAVLDFINADEDSSKEAPQEVTHIGSAEGPLVSTSAPVAEAPAPKTPRSPLLPPTTNLAVHAVPPGRTIRRSASHVEPPVTVASPQPVRGPASRARGLTIEAKTPVRPSSQVGRLPSPNAATPRRPLPRSPTSAHASSKPINGRASPMRSPEGPRPVPLRLSAVGPRKLSPSSARTPLSGALKPASRSQTPVPPTSTKSTRSYSLQRS